MDFTTSNATAALSVAISSIAAMALSGTIDLQSLFDSATNNYFVYLTMGVLAMIATFVLVAVAIDILGEEAIDMNQSVQTWKGLSTRVNARPLNHRLKSASEGNEKKISCSGHPTIFHASQEAFLIK